MKLCNFNYLKSISPDNPKFVREMIQLFLKNVPLFIDTINTCLTSSDWDGVQHSAHKIKSHFDCMGIPKDYRDTVKQIEDYAQHQKHLDLIPGLMLKLEGTIQQAYKELETELNENIDGAV